MVDHTIMNAAYTMTTTCDTQASLDALCSWTQGITLTCPASTLMKDCGDVLLMMYATIPHTAHAD